MRAVVINVLPHRRIKGDWLVECGELLPHALWYKSRDSAINYAKLLGSECRGEVRVLRGDSSTEAVIACLVQTRPNPDDCWTEQSC